MEEGQATELDALVEGVEPEQALAELIEAADDVLVTSDEAELSAGDASAEPALEAAEAESDEAGEGDPIGAESVEIDETGAGDAAAMPTSAATMDPVQLKFLVEALVFASDKPVTVQRLRQLTRVSDVRRLEQALADLAVDYAERGLVLQQVSGGYQFRTRSQYSVWVQQLIAGRPVRLSRAQLETLAIVAYRQPITRPEIDDIRGVDSSATLKLLLDRQLIRILGKKEEVGRPMLYGTTKEFLDFFSLGDLRELPTLREYSELSEESRRVVTDRLGATAETGADDDGSDGGGDGGGNGGGAGGGEGGDGGPLPEPGDQALGEALGDALEDVLEARRVDVVVTEEPGDGAVTAADASTDEDATGERADDENVDRDFAGAAASPDVAKRIGDEDTADELAAASPDDVHDGADAVGEPADDENTAGDIAVATASPDVADRLDEDDAELAAASSQVVRMAEDGDSGGTALPSEPADAAAIGSEMELAEGTGVTVALGAPAEYEGDEAAEPAFLDPVVAAESPIYGDTAAPTHLEPE